MYPAVDTGTCNGCTRCAELCPDAAISIEKRKAVIDLDFCKGCGICANECPSSAITMHMEGN